MSGLGLSQIGLGLRRRVPSSAWSPLAFASPLDLYIDASVATSLTTVSGNVHSIADARAGHSKSLAFSSTYPTVGSGPAGSTLVCTGPTGVSSDSATAPADGNEAFFAFAIMRPVTDVNGTWYLGYGPSIAGVGLANPSHNLTLGAGATGHLLTQGNRTANSGGSIATIGAGGWTSTDALDTTKTVLVAMQWDPSTKMVSAWLDGQQQIMTQPDGHLGFAVDTITKSFPGLPYSTGGGSPASANLSVAGWMVGAIPSPAEVKNLHAWALARDPSMARGRLVGLLDSSNGAGFGLTTPATDNWFNTACVSGSLTHTWIANNLSVSGRTVGMSVIPAPDPSAGSATFSMLWGAPGTAQAPQLSINGVPTLAGLYTLYWQMNAFSLRNVIVAATASNEIDHYASATYAYGNQLICAYLTQQHGGTFVAVTCAPRLDTARATTFDAQLALYNAAIRANYAAPLVVNPITVATNASPIAVTTQKPHGLSTGAPYAAIYGDPVAMGNTAANGSLVTITVTGASTFTIDGSTGNGAYLGGAVLLTGGLGCPAIGLLDVAAILPDATSATDYQEAPNGIHFTKTGHNKVAAAFVPILNGLS